MIIVMSSMCLTHLLYLFRFLVYCKSLIVSFPLLRSLIALAVSQSVMSHDNDGHGHGGMGTALGEGEDAVDVNGELNFMEEQRKQVHHCIASTYIITSLT
jgi:hypothetical protein